MVRVVERNPLAVRRRVFEEFEKVQAHIRTHPKVWRTEAFRAHSRICLSMGYDYVDYPEFEFWFSRFVQGDFNLDYDRRSDPKARSFTDLPPDVFIKIGENLQELEDRLELRDVCKDVRAHVDNWDLKVTEISYYRADQWTVSQTARSYSVDYDADVPSSFEENPLCFLMKVLKLPNLQVEELTLYEQDRNLEKFIRELDESNRKLHVKKVHFPYSRSCEIGLHFMIPGVLEEITLNDPKRETLYDIVDSEHCQAAKMVYIKSPMVISKFPVYSLDNCPRFSLQLGGGPAEGSKSRFLKRLMKYGEVQKCVLYISEFRGAPNRIMSYFNEPEAMVPNFPSLRRYPIPETNDFYELEYRENSIRLERKS